MKTAGKEIGALAAIKKLITIFCTIMGDPSASVSKSLSPHKGCYIFRGRVCFKVICNHRNWGETDDEK